MDNKLNEIRKKISFLRSEMLKAEEAIRKLINRMRTAPKPRSD